MTDEKQTQPPPAPPDDSEISISDSDLPADLRTPLDQECIDAYERGTSDVRSVLQQHIKNSLALQRAARARLEVAAGDLLTAIEAPARPLKTLERERVVQVKLTVPALSIVTELERVQRALDEFSGALMLAASTPDAIEVPDRVPDDEQEYVGDTDPELAIGTEPLDRKLFTQTWTCGCGAQLPNRYVQALIRVGRITLERYNRRAGKPEVPLYCLECGKFVGWTAAPATTATLLAARANRWHDDADFILADHSSDAEIESVAKLIRTVRRERTTEQAAAARKEAAARKSIASRRRRRSKTKAGTPPPTARKRGRSSGAGGASKARATTRRRKR